MSRPGKYPEELIQRGIRLALESERPIAHIAHDLRMHPETLRKRVRQAEADSGLRPDLPTSEEREDIKRLRKENFELRRANEILKAASVFSRSSSTQTGRSERLHRSAPGALQRRADLPDVERLRLCPPRTSSRFSPLHGTKQWLAEQQSEPQTQSPQKPVRP